MKDSFLAIPSKEYQRSFENYVHEYMKINHAHYFNKYKEALENFDEYLNRLHKLRNGIDLPQGKIATSTFWLIDSHEVVGAVRVRHQEAEFAGHIGYDISPCYRKKGYGTQILKLALKEAAKLGIKQAIVTCLIDNVGSRKIIEKNNGRLLGVIYNEEENQELYKFSVKTTQNI